MSTRNPISCETQLAIAVRDLLECHAFGRRPSPICVQLAQLALFRYEEERRERDYAEEVLSKIIERDNPDTAVICADCGKEFFPHDGLREPERSRELSDRYQEHRKGCGAEVAA